MSETENPQAFSRGVLVRAFGGFYMAAGDDGREYTLRCKKKFRHAHMSPLVGDDILFTPGEGEEHGWLEEILPRRSECLRPPVANVELLLIVIAPLPEPDLLLVDRMMVLARRQQLEIVLAVNKCELAPDMAEEIRKQYAGAEVPVFGVSAETGEGMQELREALKGRLCCFTGQSGVGKSTLLSRMLGLQLETGELSWKIQRGKNTTRHAELLTGEGLRVLDTAGFSLLELDGKMDPVTLQEYWPEFRELNGQCRFQPCCHDREPGCVVTELCAQGKLNRDRVDRYRSLLAEVRQMWRERYD